MSDKRKEINNNNLPTLGLLSTIVLFIKLGDFLVDNEN
jgi:hypothetical protein